MIRRHIEKEKLFFSTFENMLLCSGENFVWVELVGEREFRGFRFAYFIKINEINKNIKSKRLKCV